MAIMASKDISNDPKQYVEPWECVEVLENGLTLGGSGFSGQSCHGSLYVRVVESLLCKHGAWFQKPLVWAGDNACSQGYAIKEKDESVHPANLYELCKRTDVGTRVDVEELKQKVPPLSKHYRYILNHDQMCFVDYEKCISGHPLPVLTIEEDIGSMGEFSFYAGDWAYDKISVQNDTPADDFEELCAKNES